MSPPSNGELSTRDLAHALGLDRRLVSRLITKGMPRTLEGARAWRTARVRPYQRPVVENPNVVPMAPPAPADLLTTGSGHPATGGIKLLEADPREDLGSVLKWLRDLTKSYWSATTEALNAGDTARADALCRQLQSLTRNLASTEATWKKTEEKYGGLVSRDTMIRFWHLYKKSIDRAVMGLPENREKQELVDTLDRITLAFSADLKLTQQIA